MRQVLTNSELLTQGPSVMIHVQAAGMQSASLHNGTPKAAGQLDRS